MSSAEDQKTRILAAVRADESLVRSQVERRDLLLLAGGTPVLAGLVLFGAGGVHVVDRPPALVVASAALWAVVAALGTVVALRRGRSMLGSPSAWLAAGALGVVPLLAATWFLLPWPPLTVPVPHRLGLDAVCFGLTLALALAPLYAFLRVRREGDPVHPTVTGAAAGAAAGAWGATLIDLHCERVDPAHILLGHLAPVAALVVVGALLARSLLAIRLSRS